MQIILPPNVSLQLKMTRMSFFLNTAVMIIALLVLVGWISDSELLIRPLPGFAAMNPISALCLLLASVSFILLFNSINNLPLRYTGYSIAAIIIIVGGLKIVDSIFQKNIKIDYLLFSDKIDNLNNDPTGLFSNNMAINTAISLVLTGFCLLLVHTKTFRGRLPGQLVALLIAFASFLSILIYLYRVPDFTGQLMHFPMAIHTALCFLFLSGACLFAHPGEGIMKDFTSPYTGSIMARILVPVAVLIPVVLGFIRLQATWNRNITPELGVSLLVLSIILVFLAFIRYSISVLNHKDYQRELAETALRKSKERIQELFDSAPDAAVIVNEKGIIQMVNDQAEILFDYKKQELIGQAVELLLPAVLKEKHVKHRQEFMKDPHTRPMGVGLELEAVKKSGNNIPVEISLSPLHTEQGIMISASIRDVSERKKLQQQLKKFNEELEKQVEIKTVEIRESEEKFRTLIERISDGFLALDKNWRYTYTNKKIGELTRRDHLSLIGKNVWEEFPEAVGSDTYKAFLKAMEDQQYFTHTDYHAPLDLWQENHIYPSPDGLSVFIRDITERKKAEEEMNRANDELRRLSSYLQSIREEERIHIAREIHDELGQQLTGLKMYVHHLYTHPEEDQKARSKEIIELIDQIVHSVRRISSNLRPPILDDLGLVPALEWQSQEVEKRSAIKVTFESELFLLDLPVNISTGLFRIYQEALNNAVKHANAKNIHSKLELNDDRLILEISDDGKGIDWEKQKEKKTFGLLGIRERTHIMNGKIEMASESGKGTRLIIVVPLTEIIN